MKKAFTNRNRQSAGMDKDDFIFTLKVTAFAVLALILYVVVAFIQEGDVLR